MGSKAMHKNTKNSTRHAMRHGKPFGKIIRTIIKDGREWQLHATKGWRSYHLSRDKKAVA